MPEYKDQNIGQAEKLSIDLHPPQDAVAQDAVFGEITEEGPNYRNVSTTY